jgi:hypothetical protein
MPVGEMISQQEIEDAQAAWAAGVVAVGAALTWSEAHARARELVRTRYLVDDGTLLFAPTKASITPFRHALADAVSYFVGRDPNHPEDQGFALEPWCKIRFENAGVVCREAVGIAMGHYFFERADGSILQATYSFVYVRDAAGQLKIQLHHSSLPYAR